MAATTPFENTTFSFLEIYFKAVPLFQGFQLCRTHFWPHFACMASILQDTVRVGVNIDRKHSKLTQTYRMEMFYITNQSSIMYKVKTTVNGY